MAVILVVEDDAAMRRVLVETLQRTGHVVTSAVNGVEARALLARSAFDLVLTDLIMPDVEGLQLLRDIRRMSAPPKTIAMSGGGRGSAADYLAIASGMGASATLMKPFTQRAIVELIGQVLGTAAAGTGER